MNDTIILRTAILIETWRRVLKSEGDKVARLRSPGFLEVDAWNAVTRGKREQCPAKGRPMHTKHLTPIKKA